MLKNLAQDEAHALKLTLYLGASVFVLLVLSWALALTIPM